jgi:hypothetical protein
VTPWDAAANNPDYLAFLLSRGWTQNAWNKTQPWERGAEYVEFDGGPLQKTGILRELPGAISETVKEQGRAVGGVVQSVSRSVNRTLMIAAVVAVAGVLVVYRSEVKKATEATAKAVKKVIN